MRNKLFILILLSFFASGYAWAIGNAKIVTATNFIAGYATTATSGGTTTLTATSARKQVFTGTSNQTVQLPAVSTLAQGTDFIIQNNSTGIVTVTSSGGNVITTLASQQLLPFTSNATSGTGASVWDFPSILGQVAQAQLWGTVVVSGCAGAWTGTSASYASFAAQTGCTYTASGNLTAPATQIPGVSSSSLPPGHWVLVSTGTIGGTGTSDSFFRLSDGTNVSSDQPQVNSSASTNGVPVLTTAIDYTTAQSNVTLQIQYKAASGTSTIWANSANGPLVMRLYYFPSQQQTVASLGNISANWSGYQTVSGGCNTTSSSFADPAACTSIALTTIGTPHGITCSQSGTGPAISCTVPKAGNLKVCAAVNGSVGAQTVYGARLVDSSGTIIDPGRTLGVQATAPYAAVNLCGNYTAANTTPSFKVQLASTASTNINITNGAGPSGASAVQWTVEQIDSPGPQPYATGNLTVNGPSQYYIQGATVGSVCSSSPCTIDSQDGSWLTSITRNGTGDYTLNIATGAFSDVPRCWGMTGGDGSGNSYVRYKSLISFPPTKTSVRIVTGNSSGVSDQNFTIQCKGPH